MTSTEALNTLAARFGELPERDQSFARSLLDQAGNFRGLSEKQQAWVVILAGRITSGNPGGERVKTKVGDLTGIMRLFETAKKRLKLPAVVITIGGSEYRIALAGPRGRVPGSLNIVDAAETAYGERPTWFGRILQSGEFEASPRDPTPAGLTEGLAQFAAAPAETAAAHGRLTGRCCFCNLKLTDGRSTSVGYGQTCAKNYEMPFPTAKESRAKTAALFAEAA